MKTAEELSKLESMQELCDLHLFDIAPHAHIIIGPNGKCMCGVYESQSMTCLQIFAMQSHEIQSAMHAGELAAIGGGYGNAGRD